MFQKSLLLAQDGSHIFVQNIGMFLLGYMATHPRKYKLYSHRHGNLNFTSRLMFSENPLGGYHL
jgi:hypothetical protein